MSQIHINPFFFRFCRVTMKNQSFNQEKKMLNLAIQPNKRYNPVFHHHQQKVKWIHSYYEWMARDLNCFDSQTTLTVKYRAVRCPHCGNRVEEVNLVRPGKRAIKRLAQYLHFLYGDDHQRDCQTPSLGLENRQNHS